MTEGLQPAAAGHVAAAGLLRSLDGAARLIMREAINEEEAAAPATFLTEMLEHAALILDRVGVQLLQAFARQGPLGLAVAPEALEAAAGAGSGTTAAALAAGAGGPAGAPTSGRAAARSSAATTATTTDATDAWAAAAAAAAGGRPITEAASPSSSPTSRTAMPVMMFDLKRDLGIFITAAKIATLAAVRLERALERVEVRPCGGRQAADGEAGSLAFLTSAQQVSLAGSVIDLLLKPCYFLPCMPSGSSSSCGGGSGENGINPVVWRWLVRAIAASLPCAGRLAAALLRAVTQPEAAPPGSTVTGVASDAFDNVMRTASSALNAVNLAAAAAAAGAPLLICAEGRSMLWGAMVDCSSSLWDLAQGLVDAEQQLLPDEARLRAPASSRMWDQHQPQRPPCKFLREAFLRLSIALPALYVAETRYGGARRPFRDWARAHEPGDTSGTAEPHPEGASGGAGGPQQGASPATAGAAAPPAAAGAGAAAVGAPPVLPRAQGSCAPATGTGGGGHSGSSMGPAAAAAAATAAAAAAAAATAAYYPPRPCCRTLTAALVLLVHGSDFDEASVPALSGPMTNLDSSASLVPIDRSYYRRTTDGLLGAYIRMASERATPADEEVVLWALRALWVAGVAGGSSCGVGGGSNSSGGGRDSSNSSGNGCSGSPCAATPSHPSVSAHYAGSAGGGSCGGGSGSGTGAGLLRDEGTLSSGFGLRTCTHPSCTNFTEACEADLRLERCSACLRVAYCGRKCQAAHWKAGHKGECGRPPAAAVLQL